MNKLYHGCAKGYLDGSHLVIKKDEKCLIPDTHNVINTLKAGSQIEKQKN